MQNTIALVEKIPGDTESDSRLILCLEKLCRISFLFDVCAYISGVRLTVDYMAILNGVIRELNDIASESNEERSGMCAGALANILTNLVLLQKKNGVIPPDVNDEAFGVLPWIFANIIRFLPVFDRKEESIFFDSFCILKNYADRKYVPAMLVFAIRKIAVLSVHCHFSYFGTTSTDTMMVTSRPRNWRCLRLSDNSPCAYTIDQTRANLEFAVNFGHRLTKYLFAKHDMTDTTGVQLDDPMVYYVRQAAEQGLSVALFNLVKRMPEIEWGGYSGFGIESRIGIVGGIEWREKNPIFLLLTALPAEELFFYKEYLLSLFYRNSGEERERFACLQRAAELGSYAASIDLALIQKETGKMTRYYDPRNYVPRYYDPRSAHRWSIFARNIPLQNDPLHIKHKAVL
jgi:hypothetical protein